MYLGYLSFTVILLIEADSAS